MKKNVVTIILICISTILFSQNKILTIDDAVIGVNAHMYPERISRLQWQGDSENYTFVKDNTIIQSNVKSKKETEIFTLEELNEILTKNDFEERKSMPYYTWYNTNTIRFYYENNLLAIDIDKKELSFQIETNSISSDHSFHKSSKAVAYVEENNLFLNNYKNKKIKATTDTIKGIINGSGYVHRMEFGIDHGIFWSPKGNYVAFYRKDESMVTDYPLINIGERIAKSAKSKYPMAGMKSEEVTLGIFDYNKKEVTYIQTGEPKEQYLTSIAWDPSEKFIYIGVLNREQNHLKFNQYDIVSGDFVKTLFEEKNDRYVEPENSPVFFKNKPNEFLWLSERDGYKHIYQYNTEGKLLKQITKGDWVVSEIHGIDPAGNFIYFSANKENPIENHVYQYNINKGVVNLLTKEAGTHTVTFNKKFSAFFDTHSSTTVPRNYYVRNNKGKIQKTLLEASNPMDKFKVGEMSIFTLKSDDGSDLYCRMIKPLDFDPNKKYPAIVYVYGGPHSQLVTNEYLGGSWLWQYYMAQKGYVMLTLDNRGTNNRGFEFESCIHRNLGVNEVEDQMNGIEYLINTGFVDSTRIGLHGWSYGGFMTLSMISKYPDKFKVGVAGGPVIDWKYYEIMYGERYMDTPEENPEGYKKTSLLNKVSSFQDEQVLIIHGGIDDTVVPQNSLEFIEKSIKESVLIDYFAYPTHQHNVRGKDRVHLMKKVTKYFDDYL
jgi:dipeptidyl-peptidase 4